jgi:hypothetical protein
MKHNPDFDLDGVLGILNPLVENHAEGSREREAIEIARAALLYVRDSKKEDDFARYYKELANMSFTVEVSHEFATREEADKWLASGKARHAEHVKIAGKGFLVVQLPGRMTFIDRPLPEELEEEQWKTEPE